MYSIVIQWLNCDTCRVLSGMRFFLGKFRDRWVSHCYYWGYNVINQYPIFGNPMISCGCGDVLCLAISQLSAWKLGFFCIATWLWGPPRGSCWRPKLALDRCVAAEFGWTLCKDVTKRLFSYFCDTKPDYNSVISPMSDHIVRNILLAKILVQYTSYAYYIQHRLLHFKIPTGSTQNERT